MTIWVNFCLSVYLKHDSIIDFGKFDVDFVESKNLLKLGNFNVIIGIMQVHIERFSDY